MLAQMLFHPVLGRILSCRRSRYSANDVMSNGKILLLNLNGGSSSKDLTTFYGSMSLQKFVAEAFRRSTLDEKDRLQHFCFLDEFHRFASSSSGVDQILSEARKFKMSLVAATQYASKLPDTVRKECFANTACKIAFRVGDPEEANTIAKLFDDATAADLLRLDVGEAYVRVNTYSTRAQILNFDKMYAKQGTPPVREETKTKALDKLLESLSRYPRGESLQATQPVEPQSRRPKAAPQPDVAAIEIATAVPSRRVADPCGRPLTGPRAFSP